MNATVVDLRYKTRAILKALERSESVHILYHGKLKGTLVPASAPAQEPLDRHPFFGSLAKGKASVPEIMQSLRGGRHNAL